jgi:hypothetical protein
MTAMHRHLPAAPAATVELDPAAVTPVHGPDREATYREVCSGITASLPAPQVTTIPSDPAGKVRLVVDGRAQVEAWAAWLGAGAVLTHPLPDRSKRVEARLPGWLGWTAIIVTARIAPSGGAR